MIHLNLRPGDSIRVGDTLVRFITKGVDHLTNGAVVRYSRFEVVRAGCRATSHDLAFSKRLDLPAGAHFSVEKQSGRSARISLAAPPAVVVERLESLPVVPDRAPCNNRLRCQVIPR